MTKQQRNILVLALLVLLLFLLFGKRIKEQVSKKIILPNYKNCGAASSLLFPPGNIKWCIDPTTQLEFPISYAPEDAVFFELSDDALIRRSLELNRG